MDKHILKWIRWKENEDRRGGSVVRMMRKGKSKMKREWRKQARNSRLGSNDIWETSNHCQCSVGGREMGLDSKTRIYNRWKHLQSEWPTQKVSETQHKASGGSLIMKSSRSGKEKTKQESSQNIFFKKKKKSKNPEVDLEVSAYHPRSTGSRGRRTKQ